MTIAKLLELEHFEFGRLRIYDFLFLFPDFIGSIEFPRAKGIATLKITAKKISHTYERLPDGKRLFSEMGDYHIQALQILEAKGIFTEKNGIISVTNKLNSDTLLNIFEGNQYIDNEFYKKLIVTLNTVSFFGDSGLKKRTGLMEYRYDAV
ncbi:ABC-three component system middle component 5 [Shewanella frigidimarina]|uniref:ABC-three component system middle component 5 n=1 Tax=Shewanella frigidimarina TaxID=56812 RepID=UPI003D7B20DC